MCFQLPSERKGRFDMANKLNLRIYLTISVLLLLRTGSTQAATINVGSGADYDFDTTVCQILWPD